MEGRRGHGKTLLFAKAERKGSGEGNEGQKKISGSRARPVIPLRWCESEPGADAGGTASEDAGVTEMKLREEWRRGGG